jgi:GT2 family glycosyltransferase
MSLASTDVHALRSPVNDADGPSPAAGLRPRIEGKFLYAGREKLLLRGVTYGPMGPGSEGGFSAERVQRDFRLMRERGINAVRVYSVPPSWLLDAALSHGLWVMVGVAWEQHVAFLDEDLASGIERRVREATRTCSSHPATLALVVGNEIPAPIVRWHGRRRTEQFLSRLARAVKQEDPQCLVTYANYPSTEYLRLPDIDFLSFNVYLEQRDRLEAYLGRLQNIADDRPLVIAEVGLDSRGHGKVRQAHSLSWQLRSIFRLGGAGSFVFAWTDQWYRGGAEIEDWDFGLTTRRGQPKPALASVSRVYNQPLTRQRARCPKVSVVVCTYNGAATLRDCLQGVLALDYPSYEVIVVDDGSTDDSADIASEFGARVITTANRGLSAARNTGAQAASGEIVAYIDDDARPDPHWLIYLAARFANSKVGAVGGPNVLPPESGAIARCVANAPGGPTHVLTADRIAEHLPGCNLAVRRSALLEVGGFDTRFRVAGDDVDFCWRLSDAGYELGFEPGAVVLHHRRATVRAYLRQQRGYGKAEALLERKWPQRYSAGGHVDWSGQLYGNGSAQHRGGWRWRVYYGAWGSAPFQSLYGPRQGMLESLPLMPEWYLAIAVFGVLSCLGLLWAPLLAALPLLVGAMAALAADAAFGASRARFGNELRAGERARLKAITAALYLLQPLARLGGRLREGLVPWRRRTPPGLARPLALNRAIWSTEWTSLEDRVRGLADQLREAGSVVVSGGDWDDWDLQIRGGTLGVTRLRLTVEEHGQGQQMVRARTAPRLTPFFFLLASLGSPLILVTLLTSAWGACAFLGLMALAGLGRTAYEWALANNAVLRAFDAPAVPEQEPHPQRPALEAA